MDETADFLIFVDDEPPADPVEPAPPWKVAVIDDDPGVHDGTRFALADYRLGGRGLELHSARSAREGRELLARHPDTAIVLLDVVMETDGAGLDLVQYIRHELRNETVRIVLRTGQPGQAPEQRVVVEYDINDYKAKTELTAEKLFTTITAALRSYEQLVRLTETRRGLEIIVEAAANLFDLGSLQKLAEGVLTQLASLLAVDCAGILVLREGGIGEGLSVLAGSGCYSHLAGHEAWDALDRDIRALVHSAFERRRHEFLAGRYLLYIGTGSGRELVVLLDSPKKLSDTDRALIEVFCSRLAVAFDNVVLYRELQRANAELERRVLERTAELTAANTRLETQRTRLRSANAFKNEVLGTVAHDLKNPLAVILGRGEMLGELLAMDPVPVGQAEAQVVHIRDSAARLIGMVESLIADAMADASDIVVREETLDLSLLAGQVVGANAALAERKSQTIRFSAMPGLPVRGDQDRLAEAIDNLVSNAVKYSPAGAEIRIESRSEGAEALLEIADEGPGLSPEDFGRIFGRFQRLSAKPTAGESSTGLGLSIAKRIVDLHGGRLSAENGERRGTVFRLVLPLSEGEGEK
ncbi:DUF3369 domain-containing protein [Propylenella binzhouense]|uniref:histidine kinase n=1 Tax=Propylenella binzhouense TaxID=2555902 RepID=A0A964T4X4_9HYPH|nr:DUF3369 domain-containing protein [Propylenella binzhouense]